MGAMRWGIQIAAAPVIDHRVSALVADREAVASVKTMARAGATLLPLPIAAVVILVIIVLIKARLVWALVGAIGKGCAIPVRIIPIRSVLIRLILLPTAWSYAVLVCAVLISTVCGPILLSRTIHAIWRGFWLSNRLGRGPA